MKGTQFHHAYAINTHAEKTLLTPNPTLDNSIKTSTTASLPAITVSPLQGQHLSIMAQLISAKEILEIGALGGYSTIWLAQTGAHVTSIEINAKHREVAQQNTQGLPVDVILGAALDVMPKLHAEGKRYDMVFVDASWDEQWEYFDWAVKLTRPRGCIYVDNVIRELIEEADERGEIGKGKNLLSLVGEDKRVEATLVGTVNSHKPDHESYDGYLLAVVKE